MEQYQPNTDLFDADIKIDDTSRFHIAGIAQWGMIIVVTAVVGYLLAIIKVFRTSSADSQSTSSEGFDSYMRLGDDSIGGTILGIVFGLIINFFLFQFATQSRKSLAGNDQVLLASSFKNLKIYFIITTVIMIIAFLIALIAAMALT